MSLVESFLFFNSDRCKSNVSLLGCCTLRLLNILYAPTGILDFFGTTFDERTHKLYF